ncbi:MAG: FAD-dependent tricarballylate dehydrogenase TcuA [Rhodospirillales bacterium]
MPDSKYDVLVIGAGNAAFCAAHAAAEKGAKVLMLERAPEEEYGGNSRFTAGIIRFAYDGVEDIKRLVPDLSNEQLAKTDFGAYTEDKFFDDMFRVTSFRTDPEMCEMLVRNSKETMFWMHDKGVRLVPIYGRQAFEVNGIFKFWGGLALESWGGGEGLISQHRDIALKNGIEIVYGARVLNLIYDGDVVTGVRFKRNRKLEEIKAKAVVIAAGGFEANSEMRTRYLGPGWELAKVRGTRFNTGDGIRMALDIGAMPYGNWSGCHAVGWELNAPEYGDLAVGDQFQKHSYPFGVMVNANGERFVDEGADFRNYTYAKYGRAILGQPQQLCWQIFDQKVRPQIRDEYDIRQVTKATANTLEELVQKLDGVDPVQCLKTLKAYNAAVKTDTPFNPNELDGRHTEGLEINKTNWANTLDQPPFEAWATTCGVTFTFGGLRVNTDAQVMDVDMAPIPGLYAAGELVGGIFYFNYPGGSGLISGAVFGRTAGMSAGQAATK